MWFKKQNPTLRIPLPAFMATTTMVMWVIATLGVVAEMLILIPWSLGITPGVDVTLTRHAAVVLRPSAGVLLDHGRIHDLVRLRSDHYKGTIFSDSLTRVAFVLLLLLSTPVGLHHQYLDPGISSGWKFMHTVIDLRRRHPVVHDGIRDFRLVRDRAHASAGKTGFLGHRALAAVERSGLRGPGAAACCCSSSAGSAASSTTRIRWTFSCTTRCGSSATFTSPSAARSP